MCVCVKMLFQGKWISHKKASPHQPFPSSHPLNKIMMHHSNKCRKEVSRYQSVINGLTHFLMWSVGNGWFGTEKTLWISQGSAPPTQTSRKLIEFSVLFVTSDGSSRYRHSSPLSVSLRHLMRFLDQYSVRAKWPDSARPTRVLNRTSPLLRGRKVLRRHEAPPSFLSGAGWAAEHSWPMQFYELRFPRIQPIRWISIEDIHCPVCLRLFPRALGFISLSIFTCMWRRGAASVFIFCIKPNFLPVRTYLQNWRGLRHVKRVKMRLNKLLHEDWVLRSLNFSAVFSLISCKMKPVCFYQIPPSRLLFFTVSGAMYFKLKNINCTASVGPRLWCSTGGRTMIHLI